MVKWGSIMHNVSWADNTREPSIVLHQPGFHKPADCPLASCAALHQGMVELERLQRAEAELSEALLREHRLVEQKDELIRHKDLLSQESDHRLMNGLQMVASLLSIQSRATENAEAASLLVTASNRVAAIGRINRHLHALDHVESVEFKQYLESLCGDLAGMRSGASDDSLTVEGVELRIPTATGIPLAFIASELITNAIKYGKGKIAVGLHPDRDGYVLSVSDDGPGVPKEFDPAAMRGLGMRIISSLVSQIGGQLHIAPGNDGKGAKFSVLFPLNALRSCPAALN